VSIARNNNAGSVTISDGVNTQIFNAGPNNILQHVSFTTGTFTDVITITRNNGNTYVDGISYSYNELGCDSPVSLTKTIVVNQPVQATFNSISSICMGATPPGLQALSNQGFSGTWSPSAINTSVAGTYNFTFTPNFEFLFRTLSMFRCKILF
jgi:hypothetical protein